jgi:hypothetical protein
VDKLGFDLPIWARQARSRTEREPEHIQDFAKDGGMFCTIFGGKTEILWDGMQGTVMGQAE